VREDAVTDFVDNHTTSDDRRWVMPLTPGPWAQASIMELRALADRHGLELPDPQVRRALAERERRAGQPEGYLLAEFRRSR
jgi:hypothetical protein